MAGSKSAHNSSSLDTASLADYQKLGDMIGKLHTLPVETSLPEAVDLPRRDLVWVKDHLASMAADVPPTLCDEYNGLSTLIDRTDLCEDLPNVLLHNDCQPWNVVRSGGGTMTLVDWAGSGIGPAVIDIAEFIGKCHLAKDRPDEALIQTIMRGYSRHRPLHLTEIKCLPDAMRFRPLVLLGGFYNQRIDGTFTDDDQLYGRRYRDWWSYLALTEEIAERAMYDFVTAGDL